MGALRRKFRTGLPLRYGHLHWCAAMTCTVLGLAIAAFAASGWTAPVTLANPIPPADVLMSPVIGSIPRALRWRRG